MEIIKEESLPIAMHREWHGKIETSVRAPLENSYDLALAYTPGVAEPCLEIKADERKSFDFTRRWNTVAVVTNGTAVLGLGDIGPAAGLPVMEGKAALFKAFGGVDAFPICIGSKDPEKVIETVALIESSFGGINLEDISAPSCFEIENELKKRLSIPVMHDDQHGTATVVLAALKNALKLAGKDIAKVSIVINGCGAAGSAIAKLLIKAGAKKIVMCDRKGILSEETTEEGTYKRELAMITNRRKIKGKLSYAMKKADVFIGVSAANVLKAEDIAAMNEKPIIFAMANPIPEILPDVAAKAGAFIIGTGRSDYPNQINNVLAFPGIFRGALDAEARDITDDMLVAAADAIASLVGEDELCPEKVVPDAFDGRIAATVAEAVRSVAEKTGVARKFRDKD
ncbi:MAG: NADP-dependent malic enzyme [Clostridia bacterium]|nr:NADP-dependent malic enzyme [Clostridia bacterium]